MRRTTTFADISCPHCGQRNEMHSSPDRAVPGTGCVSMCWACRNFGIFVEVAGALTVRRCTPQEEAEVRALPQARAALAAAAESYTTDEFFDLWPG